MESMLSTLAFALLIGAQFLAAIVLISKRKAIYGELEDARARSIRHPNGPRSRLPRGSYRRRLRSPTVLAAPNYPILPSQRRLHWS